MAAVAAALVTIPLGLVVSTSGASAVNGEPIPLAPAVDTAGADRATLPLTLITGDTVHVGIDGDGKPVVQDVDQAARPDGLPVAFHTITRDQRTYLVPGDAMDLLAADKLDWELFDLVELGKHVVNGTVGAVPVIVERTGSAAARSATPQVAGATVERELPSVDSVAMTVDGDGSWWQAVQAAVEDAPAARASSTGPLAGVEKVWLNGVVQVSLADSVPQIGAPTAWGSGFDGTGVTVAVLDTGIDANHPDVAGKIVGQRDFIDEDDDASDGHGHGTHVAATVAGTGDAAGGLRPGVAPGADLLIGKVLSDRGSGTDAQVLAGMEWAAQSGAPIVSMSLGGAPTNGRDPLSMAVNQLSAQYGTLFVIAAGNSGPSNYTIGTPGAAEAALTVAAVDKADQMASFSSRGPVVASHAPKPDIAAPGVGIVAARAAGTTMGTPVDDLYTAASGTSMATPHVAGAAALLVQQNPELIGSELKGLLMGTALDLGEDVLAQGSGRLDVAKAIDPAVFSDGNIGFGRLAYPHQPVTDTITFTNVTDAPISLDLAASMTTTDGTAAPDGLLRLSADQVTVPASGTATVDVTLDGSVLGDGDAFGEYRGLVIAADQAGDTRASARISAFLEPERYDVTVEFVPPAGAVDVRYLNAAITPVDDQVALHSGMPPLPGGQTSTTERFDGTYTVTGEVRWQDAAGNQHYALPSLPEVTVAGSDITVQLDLNQAQPVYTDVGEDTETYDARLQQSRVSETGHWRVNSTLHTEYALPETTWWVLPTEPVTRGSYSFTSQQVLVPPMVAMEAIGGGRLSLHPRYVTPDVSIPGGYQRWEEGEEAFQREVRLPVPRLTGLDRSRLVHAGAGTPAELDAAGVDGALVLITPTADVCDGACKHELLRPILVAAAERGAVGVLVAGDPSAEANRVLLRAPGTVTYQCPDGPGSCPPIAPYAPIPVVSLPTAEGATLVDRLAARDSLRVFVRGHEQAPRAYALARTVDGQVPDSMPWQADRSGLDRLTHRFHAEQPGEVFRFTMDPVGPSVAGASGVDLPLTATQSELPVYSLPSQDDPIGADFSVSSAAYAEPMVLGATVAERMGLVMGVQDTVSWNTRPSTPAAIPQQPLEGGLSELADDLVCAGCREGDIFFPILYRTTGGGAVTQLAGLMNNRSFARAWLKASSCEPPQCELHLYDEAGNELEQRLIPIQIGVGNDGQLTGIGFGATDSPIFEETNR